MDYAPNEDAALWLVQDIWPLVRAGGSPRASACAWWGRPHTRLRAACRADASIEVTGVVPDVRPMLWESAVAAAPLRNSARSPEQGTRSAGSGTTNGDYTGCGGRTFPPMRSPAARSPTSPEDFAASLVERLALEPANRRAYAARAQLSGLDWNCTLSSLWPILMQSCAKYRVIKSIAGRLQFRDSLTRRGNASELGQLRYVCRLSPRNVVPRKLLNRQKILKKDELRRRLDRALPCHGSPWHLRFRLVAFAKLC